MITRYQNIIGVITLSFIFLISVINRQFVDKNQLIKVILPTQEHKDEYRISRYNGDQVQLKRKSQLIKSCMKRAGHAVMKPMNPYFATKFFPSSLTLAEEEGIGWCRVGKVGTTAWSALFLLIREVPLNQIKEAVVSLTAHDLLKQKYPSRPSERMHMIRGEHGKDYFKFLVVRHPFVRLVSAYRDKLETLTEYNVRYHMTDAPRMTSRRSYNSSVADNPTFPEFVDYLIRTPPNIMDKHWAPYTKVCIPCNISYDAILKLETLKTDADWLFEKLDLKDLREDWDKVAGINKADADDDQPEARVHGGPGGGGGLPSEVLARKYFSQISKENITRLYLKYQVDFEMFGYENEVQSFINMGI